MRSQPRTLLEGKCEYSWGRGIATFGDVGRCRSCRPPPVTTCSREGTTKRHLWDSGPSRPPSPWPTLPETLMILSPHRSAPSIKHTDYRGFLGNFKTYNRINTLTTRTPLSVDIQQRYLVVLRQDAASDEPFGAVFPLLFLHFLLVVIYHKTRKGLVDFLRNKCKRFQKRK